MMTKMSSSVLKNGVTMQIQRIVLSTTFVAQEFQNVRHAEKVGYVIGILPNLCIIHLAFQRKQKMTFGFIIVCFLISVQKVHLYIKIQTLVIPAVIFIMSFPCLDSSPEVVNSLIYGVNYSDWKPRSKNVDRNVFDKNLDIYNLEVEDVIRRRCSYS